MKMSKKKNNMNEMPNPFNMFNMWQNFMPPNQEIEEEDEEEVEFNPFQFPMMPFNPFMFNNWNYSNNEVDEEEDEEEEEETVDNNFNFQFPNFPFMFNNFSNMPFGFPFANNDKFESFKDQVKEYIEKLFNEFKKNKNGIPFGNFVVPVELLHFFLNLNASPKTLENIQKLLDKFFETYDNYKGK